MRADEQMLLALWGQDAVSMPTDEIARRLRCAVSTVHQMRRRLGLRPRRRFSAMKGTQKIAIDEDEFRRLWGMTMLEMPTKLIAEKLGISPSTVSATRIRLRLPVRERLNAAADSRRIELDVPLLYKLWSDSTISMAEVARRLGGVSQSHLYSLARRHKLPPRPAAETDDEERPTKEEIEAGIAEVQRTWTPGIRRQRQCGGGLQRWRPPAVLYDGRDAAFVPIGVDK